MEEREENSCVPPNFLFNWWRALPHHLVQMTFLMTPLSRYDTLETTMDFWPPDVPDNSLENTEPALALPVPSGIILHNPLLKNDGFLAVILKLEYFITTEMITANSKDGQGAQNDPIMFPTMRPLERAPERGGNALILCFNIQQTEQPLQSSSVQLKVLRSLFFFKPAMGPSLGLSV